MIEKLLLWAIIAACVVFLIRLTVGEQRRRRFDGIVRRGAARGAAWGRAIQNALLRWRSSRVAAKAIRRARTSDGQWKGNVYTPRSFRKPRKPH